MKKKQEKAVSDYFREMAKKSWEKRKANILSKAKVAPITSNEK